MSQLSSMVKTFVEGQDAMLESLDEMIERHSQEQVSGSLQPYLTLKTSFIFVSFCNNLSALFSIAYYICYGSESIQFELKTKISH